MTMKFFSLFFFTSLLLSSVASAEDVNLILVEEHYEEKMVVGNGMPQIFHTFQVESPYGSKFLILTGDNYSYRQWFRKNIRNQRNFILKIPDDGISRFIKNRIVYIDIQQINPVYGQLWSCDNCRSGPPPSSSGAGGFGGEGEFGF